MPLETILHEMAVRYPRIRCGLDVGFEDEDITNALRELRGGVWMSINARTEFPFEDEQFEVVVMNGAVVSRAIVREANRVLRPEGCLFFTVPERTRRQAGYTLPELYRVIREGFDIVSVKRPKWWFFKSRGRTMTVCARKKAWREFKGFKAAHLSLRTILLGALLSVAGTAVAQIKTSAQAIEVLLNAHEIGRAPIFAEAATRVAAEAAAGQPLQRYVMGVLADEKHPCAVMRLSKETCETYLKASRPRILALALKNNNGLAWYLLSIEKNDRKLLRRAADAGNIQALNAMGTVLIREGRENPKQMVQGFQLFQQAAAKGDANGLYNMASCYLQGLGCDKDEKKGLAALQQAADKGQPFAMDVLAASYERGLSGLPKSTRLSLLWQMRARAARGDEAAATWLKENQTP